MRKQKIYSVYDNGEYMGSLSPDVIEMVIGIPKYRVITYAKDELLYHKRYSFELESSETQKECDEKLEDDLRLTARFLLLASKAGWKRGN